jgi:hypothetical protein
MAGKGWTEAKIQEKKPWQQFYSIMETDLLSKELQINN